MPTLLLGFGAVASGQSLNADQQAIEQVINQFVQAGDDRNVPRLETLLHPEHRIILSRFRGSTETAILSRATYLDMIGAGKLGGEKRTVSIQSIDALAHTASARVILETDKQRFRTVYLFVKTGDAWQLITDMPVLEPIVK